MNRWTVRLIKGSSTLIFLPTDVLYYLKSHANTRCCKEEKFLLCDSLLYLVKYCHVVLTFNMFKVSKVMVEILCQCPVVSNINYCMIVLAIFIIFSHLSDTQWWWNMVARGLLDNMCWNESSRKPNPGEYIYQLKVYRWNVKRCKQIVKRWEFRHHFLGKSKPGAVKKGSVHYFPCTVMGPVENAWLVTDYMSGTWNVLYMTKVQRENGCPHSHNTLICWW